MRSHKSKDDEKNIILWPQESRKGNIKGSCHNPTKYLYTLSKYKKNYIPYSIILDDIYPTKIEFCG